MNWNTDPETQFSAHNCPVLIQAAMPAPQYPGRPFVSVNWIHRIRPQDMFAENVQNSSPQSIIDAFRNEEYLQGLALVVSWGSMWRTSNSIYGNDNLQAIQDTLRASAQSSIQTENIDSAWTTLTGNLHWSAVITSKVLHFICRSLGFENDPPVAIDNAVFLKKVWPAFRNHIPFELRPQGWRGNGLDAYLRYMTAIIEWASMRNWTTTQIETTLFNEYRNRAEQEHPADRLQPR